jgi:hypothetical protein
MASRLYQRTNEVSAIDAAIDRPSDGAAVRSAPASFALTPRVLS